MPKVIIVDDEKYIVSAIQKYISTYLPSFEVCGCFFDGEDALDFVVTNSVDIVITDICMPNMDGLELTKEIYDRNLPCKIIIISGYSEFEYAQSAIKYHVFNYLLKPLDFKELNNSLLAIVKKQGVYQAVPEMNSDSQFDDIIEKAIKYLDDHYSEDLNREELANVVFLSPPHFSYLFKKKTGITYMDYLTKLRIQKAKELLGTNMKISDISKRVGYTSPNRFFINFRNYTGYTPSDYRKKLLCQENLQDSPDE